MAFKTKGNSILEGGSSVRGQPRKARHDHPRPRELRPGPTPDIIHGTMRLTYGCLLVMFTAFAWAQAPSRSGEVETVFTLMPERCI